MADDQVPDWAKKSDAPEWANPDTKTGDQKDGPPVPPSSKLERFGTGVMDPVYGLAQASSDPAYLAMEAGTTPDQFEGTRDAATKFLKGREEEYKKGRDAAHSEGLDWMRLAGNLVGSAPFVAPLSAGGGGIVGGAMTGAASNLLMPATGADYGQEKLKQGLMGGAFGGLGAGAARAVGAVVGPTVRETAKMLMDKGIQLTPGQIAGGVFRRAEEAAKSFPILGSFIRGAENRGVDTFNRATIDQALEPIGVKLPAMAKMGHEAITYGRLRLDDAYDTLLPKMQLAMDERLSTDIGNVRFLASELPDAQAKQFETIMANRVAQPFTDTGAIPGRTLKRMESDLNQIASTYRSSADAAQRQLAHLLDEVRGSIREALERQNPQLAGELKKINQSYAMFTRIESAAARRAGSQGMFTPGDLLQSIKNADRSVRKGNFARGDALMQDFAEFADMVLPSKLPDSGTSERAMWDMMGLGAALYKPEIPIGLGAASLPYTQMGQKVVNKIAQPGAARQAVGEGIRRAAPAIGGATADTAITFTGDNQ